VPRKDFTKAELRTLRDLAGTAYERELDAALKEFAADVDDWRAGRINAFDLSDCIHEFHNTTARELWKLYNGLKPPFIVTSALERGVLVESDVPGPLRARLRARFPA